MPADITAFAHARLDDLAGLWDSGCEGAAEYVSCYEITIRLPAIIAAQRAILAEHQPTEETDRYDDRAGREVTRTVCAMCVYTLDDTDGMDGRFRTREHASWPCATVLAVASPWKDHPDYQREWVD